VRSRTAGVMTTLMRNGRDRRLEKPVKCHARKERVFLVGTRSADHIRASGHSGCIQRPDTWLHPNASLKCQIPLAPRAPSIHGTFRTSRDVRLESAMRAKADAPATGRRDVESTMPDPDPNPFADCDTIVCYGNAKPTDTHTASVIHCIDGEIIGWLERQERRRRDTRKSRQGFP